MPKTPRVARAPAAQRAEAEIRRERERSEAARAESEARKTAILESVLDCIITIDSEGTVTEFNAAAVRTFGYAKGEAIGRPLADLIIPARFRDRHRDGLARCLATGEGPLIGKLLEVTAVRSDGSEIPVELAITAVRSGSVPIFIGVLRDITARRHADATRARLAAIVDSSDDAIYGVALDGTVLTWNAGAERLYGYAASEMIGQSRAILVPAEKRAELVPIMDRAARGDAGAPFETQRLRKDGSVVDISLVLSPMTDASGTITAVSTIARDITGRKSAEAELKGLSDEIELQRLRQVEAAQKRAEDLELAEAAVRAERDRAQRYLDTAEVILLNLDPQGRITLVNRYACSLFGWPAEELLGRPFIETCVPARLRDETMRKLGNVLAGPDSSVVDYAIVTRAGEERLIEWRNTLLRDEAGRLAGTLSSGTDITEITERRTLEEQYQQAQKMEAIGRLAGGVAHDFNNLLTIILGFCELLLADLNPDDPRQADIFEIQKAGESAAGLTRQLLAFSRKEIIEPTLLDVNVLVADVRGLLERLIGEDVKVVLGVEPALAPVRCDRGQVEQIVLNLAVNARDAMPKGGTLTMATANLELDADRSTIHGTVKAGKYVALMVIDTGTGIQPEVMARLFEPFFTTKGAGKGTGLGLATVHGIVSRCGGGVSVESELGKGTTFTVFLPRADPGDRAVTPPAIVDQPRAGTQTILLVEDAHGLRALTRRLLERQGYTVLAASGADQARQLFEANESIDLLLTDVVMPDTSGPDLVARLVELRPALKVIYMSGYTDEAIVHHGVLDPGIDFVQKPFTSETLGRKIREVLER